MTCWHDLLQVLPSHRSYVSLIVKPQHLVIQLLYISLEHVFLKKKKTKKRRCLLNSLLELPFNEFECLPRPPSLAGPELRNYSKRRGRGESLAVLISQSRAFLREWCGCRAKTSINLQGAARASRRCWSCITAPQPTQAINK